MASFAAQAALRAKWSDLVEGSTFEIPEVSSGVKSVVGWLKQVCFKSKKRENLQKKKMRDKYKAPDMLLQYFCFLFFFFNCAYFIYFSFISSNICFWNHIHFLLHGYALWKEHCSQALAQLLEDFNTK